MEVDAFLTSSSSMSAFQFSGMFTFAGPDGFIGGFNALPNGRLQLQTAGFPQSAPVIVRDVWQHWAVLFNFSQRSFNVYIDGSLVAANLPFLNPFSSFEFGFFDVVRQREQQ